MSNLLNDSDSKRVADYAMDAIEAMKRDITQGVSWEISEALRRMEKEIGPKYLGEAIIRKVGYTIEACLHSKEYADMINGAIEQGVREGIENRETNP